MPFSTADADAQNDALAYLLLAAQPGVTFEEIGVRSRSTYTLGEPLWEGDFRVGAHVQVVSTTLEPFDGSVVSLVSSGPMTVKHRLGEPVVCVPHFVDEEPVVLGYLPTGGWSAVEATHAAAAEAAAALVLG